MKHSRLVLLGSLLLIGLQLAGTGCVVPGRGGFRNEVWLDGGGRGWYGGHGGGAYVHPGGGGRR